VIPPGQTVEEYYCRLAYGLAEDRLGDTPRRAEVLRRLRAELRAAPLSGPLPAVE
jgi:hypothetical protein